MKDEVEIEVFRADTTASRGITSAHIADLAGAFDGSNPVPIVIGHPKSDSPAHGEVIGFRAEGPSLFAKLKSVGQEVIDGIKAKKILNRSMAFFDPAHEANPTPGKLAPRHLGFLGGAAPGIPGMQRLDQSALAFSADGEDFEITGEPAEAVVFANAPTPVFTVHDTKETSMDPNAPTPDQIAADRAALDAERATFAAEVKTARETANKAIVDGLVTAGKVLPANAPALAMVFNALASDTLEFAADDKATPAAKLAAILSAGPALVDLKGKPISAEFAADPNAGDKPKDAAGITAAARQLQKDRPGLSFEAAVETVTKGN